MEEIIDAVYEEVKEEPETFRVIVGDLIEVCPGKSHAWYNSNVGVIRKPIQ